MASIDQKFTVGFNNGLLILVALLMMPTAWSATIDVQVDRNVIEEGESINVQFSSNQGIDDDPDFTPLNKDFSVHRPNRSYSMSFINGKLSRSTSWSITLVPKRTGIFQIPVIHFGKDSSRPLRVQVKPASLSKKDNSDQLFILEVKADKRNVYIQSQIILSVKIYHAVGFVSASLSDINLDDSDAIVEKLGDDLNYDKRIKDRLYKVFEKRYAIYPQKSGTLIIDPVLFEGQYASTRQPTRRTWPGLSLPRATEIKRLRSKAIEIKVRPVPSSFKGEWVPANKVTLTENWSDRQPEFVVGEPITRVISLEVNGLLSSQIPEIHKSDIKNIKQYTDQPVLANKSSVNGIIGTRRESIAIIPTVAGQYTLPAIEVPWWNINTSKREVARIKQQIIMVAEAPNTIVSTAPLSLNIEPLDVEVSASLKTENNALVTMFDDKNSQYLLLIIASLLVGWILTILAWWYSDKNLAKNSTPSSPNISVDDILSTKQIKRKLASACNENNKDLIKQLLLNWGKTRFPDQAPNNLGQLSIYCSEPFKSQLMNLNSALYDTFYDSSTEDSGTDNNWDGKLLLEAFLKYDKTKPEQTIDANPTIKALQYKVVN